MADVEYEQEQIFEDSPILGWRIIKTEEDGHQIVEPFFKVRTSFNFRDLVTSSFEWFFNRKGYRVVGLVLIFVSFLIFSIVDFSVYLTFISSGAVVGLLIVIYEGRRIVRKDRDAVILSMMKGRRKYVRTTLDKETGMPIMQYIETSISFFGDFRIPSSLVNKTSDNSPDPRGFQFHKCPEIVYNGKKFHFADWADSTTNPHVFFGGTFSLSNFIMLFSNIDQRVLKISKKYDKKLRWARKMASNKDAKQYPTAMELLEFDKRLKVFIEQFRDVIIEGESIAGKSPFQINIEKLDKYTQRFFLATASYNGNKAMIESNKTRLSMDELQDKYMLAEEIIESGKSMPTLFAQYKRKVLRTVISMLDDLTGYSAEHVQEGQKLMRKRLEYMLEDKDKDDKESDQQKNPLLGLTQ